MTDRVQTHGVARRRRNLQHPGKPGPGIELLEVRSLLSAQPLAGFPVSGFQAGKLGGSPPWDVSIVVDGQPISAVAYAEGSEQMKAASQLVFTPGTPTWIAGIIGDTLRHGPDAAVNDVDLYRLDLSGSTHYAVNLEVFAQRFGDDSDTGLDSAVSVFDANGQLIVSNDLGPHGAFPKDAALDLGLDSGTYFVAVSGGGNVPGVSGGFDVHVPGSGHASRGSTGPYLLRISAQPDVTRPQVIGINFADGQTFQDPPAELVVRFSESIKLAGLSAGTELTDGNGAAWALRATHYDSITHEVTYLLLDRPLAGDYRFTLHSDLVKDFADNPLDGGAADGDFTAGFHVGAASVTRVDLEPNDSAAAAESIGVLYPEELARGVAVTGELSSPNGPSGDHDFYRFRVLQPGTNVYKFMLTPTGGSTGTGLITIYDAEGIIRRPATASSNSARLAPGEYLVEIAGMPDGVSAEFYQLTISMSRANIPGLSDNSPGPAIQVVLQVSDGGGSGTVVDTGQVEEEESSASGWLAGATNALPRVGSQPIGVPRAELVDPSLLAWLDESPGGAGLPAGFVLDRAAGNPQAWFSAVGVSGSFLDPLPDAIPPGTYSLSPSTAVVSELTALLRGPLGSAGLGHAAIDGTGFGADSGGLDLDVASNDAVADAGHAALTSPSLAMGMVASLGAATVLTVPNRRRNANWLHQAFQWLGLS